MIAVNPSAKIEVSRAYDVPQQWAARGCEAPLETSRRAFTSDRRGPRKRTGGLRPAQAGEFKVCKPAQGTLLRRNGNRDAR